MREHQHKLGSYLLENNISNHFVIALSCHDTATPRAVPVSVTGCVAVPNVKEISVSGFRNATMGNKRRNK